MNADALEFVAAAHAIDMIADHPDPGVVDGAIIGLATYGPAAPRWATGPRMADTDDLDEIDLLTDAAIRGY